MAPPASRGVLRWLKQRKTVLLIFVFSFIVSGLIVNLLQLLTLPLYFVKKRLYRIVNARLVYLHWCVVPWAVQSWANYDIRIFANEPVEQFINIEHALCVLNHRGDMDWMVGWCLIDRARMLGGTKAIMKDVAKYLPGIGWTFMFMEYPFLKRDWVTDKPALEKSCRNLSDYPVNMLLCLFAEGTRFTEEKHKISVEFAKSRGLPIFKHHLIPRTKGFCFLVKHLKDTVHTVYDITISYRDGEPSVLGAVNAEPCGADLMLRRFEIKDLPTENEEELAEWLVQLFKEKDELVDYHMKHKTFPSMQVNLPRRVWPDVIVFLWVSLLGVPAFFATLYLFWIGAWFTMGLIVISVILADVLFQYIVRETNTKHTSSGYGLKRTSNGSIPTASTDKKAQ